MTAGRRDKLVMLERFEATRDQWNEEVQAWEPIGSEWAAVFYGLGQERRQAAMEQGSQAATFQMLMNDLTESLTVNDRLSFNGEWDIKGIAPDTPKRGEIEFTAVRAA